MGLVTAKKNVPALGKNLRQLAVNKKEQNMFFVQFVLCPTIRLFNLIESQICQICQTGSAFSNLCVKSKCNSLVHMFKLCISTSKKTIAK